MVTGYNGQFSPDSAMIARGYAVTFKKLHAFVTNWQPTGITALFGRIQCNFWFSARIVPDSRKCPESLGKGV